MIRWLAAGAVALAATGGIVLLTASDEANGGPEANAAKWATLQSSPLTRTEVGAARVGDSIYVAGGFIAPDGRTTDRVARYDIATGGWEVLAPMPIAVNHPAVAAAGGRVYVHGGYAASDGLAGEIDALQRYDPATGSWSTLAPSGFPRAAHALVRARGLLYAIGGAHHDGDPVKLVEVYDPAVDDWFRAPRMPTAREHLGAALAGGRIVVLGGRAGGRNLRTVEALDVKRDRWERLRPLRLARSGFQAARVGGEVVVAGGEELAEGDETIAAVELYDPGSDESRSLPRLATPRHGLGVVSSGRRVFTIEGGPRPGLSFSAALEVLRVP